jgi:hypothetical protein
MFVCKYMYIRSISHIYAYRSEAKHFPSDLSHQHSILVVGRSPAWDEEGVHGRTSSLVRCASQGPAAIGHVCSSLNSPFANGCCRGAKLEAGLPKGSMLTFFVLGITGGSASGKTSVSRYCLSAAPPMLTTLPAAPLSISFSFLGMLVGHKLYMPMLSAGWFICLWTPSTRISSLRTRPWRIARTTTLTIQV